MAEDLRSLIPAIRRAIDGPAADSFNGVSASMPDDQIKALAADAVSEIILLTGGLFGHTLLVTARDSTYEAPSDWAIDPALEEDEKTLIVAQAALRFFFHKLRDVKVSETIRDEGAEWSYALSSTLIRDEMAYLQAARDAALKALETQHPIPIAYRSLIAERDHRAHLLLHEVV